MIGSEMEIKPSSELLNVLKHGHAGGITSVMCMDAAANNKYLNDHGITIEDCPELPVILPNK
jgi:hypothetical protein